MALREAEQYLLQGKQLQKSSQILQEISWFVNLYHPSPMVYIVYDRLAMCGNENFDLRITLDTNIRWRQTMLGLDRGAWGNSLLPKGQYLLEIKIPDAMPLWLSRVLTELQLLPISFSKYGNCYLEHLMHSVELGGIHSAREYFIG